MAHSEQFSRTRVCPLLEQQRTLAETGAVWIGR